MAQPKAFQRYQRGWSVFAWVKTIAGQRKTKHRGLERVRWQFTLAAAAYNLIRLPKLLGAAP